MPKSAARSDHDLSERNLIGGFGSQIEPRLQSRASRIAAKCLLNRISLGLIAVSFEIRARRSSMQVVGSRA
jgi:hypothetical protein